MPLIEIHTEIHAPISVVFDLARSIDLHSLSTSNTQEKAVAGRTSGLIELGETVTWQATHLGVRQKLTSKISALDKPYYFVDEMVKGAFKSIYHQHIFQQKDDAVMMIDKFEFQSPFGWLGKLANTLFLTNYMKKFLSVRNQFIKEFAETDRWEEVLKLQN